MIGKMRKQILGLIVAVITFLFAFYFAPIRFSREGVGSGTVGAGSFCSFSIYSSSHFSNLTYWTCTFEDEGSAEAYFETVKSKQHIQSAETKHILVKYDNEFGTYYCSTRLDEDSVDDVCSPSVDVITEFETQSSTNHQ